MRYARRFPMTKQSLFLVFVAAALVACGGNGNPVTTDAGTADSGSDGGGGGGDGGRDAGGGGSVCDAPTAVTLAAGAQMVTGDTTGHTTGLVGLGACGGPTGQPQPAEVVYALTLPGTATDDVAVSYTLVNDGTDEAFDTTTQIRTACGTTPTADGTCFDDTDGTEIRSTGGFTAMGGSVVYLVVTGYRQPVNGAVNEGAFQIDFTTYVNPTAPTYTSGTATLIDGNDLDVSIMGMDAQGAALGIQYAFLDGSGTPIGLDIDGDPSTPAVSDLQGDFRPAVTGMTTFTGVYRVTGLSDFPEVGTNAASLRVAIYSDTGLVSAPEAMISITHATTVHVGETCDATHFCGAGVECTAGVCTVPAGVDALCAAATAITLDAQQMATQHVAFTTAEGLLEGDCAGAGGGGGDEHVYTVTVPAGNWDLIASTTPNGTMDPDTVVYVRDTNCGDPTYEIACNDDAMMGVLASAIELRDVAAGPHFLVVDAWETLTAAAETDLTVRLRPVLAMGATCDPAGVTNRCATAPCPATGTAVCP